MKQRFLCEHVNIDSSLTKEVETIPEHCKSWTNKIADLGVGSDEAKEFSCNGELVIIYRGLVSAALFQSIDDITVELLDENSVVVSKRVYKDCTMETCTTENLYSSIEGFETEDSKVVEKCNRYRVAYKCKKMLLHF